MSKSNSGERDECMRICVRACCALQGRVGVRIQRIQVGVRREDGGRRIRRKQINAEGQQKKIYEYKCK